MSPSPTVLALTALLSTPSPTSTATGGAATAATVTPSATPTPDLPFVSLQGVKTALRDACGDPPGILCRTVFSTTHSEYLASGAQVFLGTPVKIALILLVAAMLRSLVYRAIGRTIGRAASGAGPGLLRGGLLGAFGDPSILLERRRQRAQTVGSLLRSVTSIVVFGIAFVIVLGELGINLAPIVASAGVLGIAVGFGAQNLVRDFLSGMFMLLEDQYGVGDVIDVGPVAGSVEAVSFRITRLRDVEGTVWYVRNGEITRIGNKSQQWSRTVLDVPLDYETDVAEARAVLLRAATEMWRHDTWAAVIIAAPEVWGMETMTADGYTLRVAVKTQPLKQWDVARELRERLRNALSEAGIALGAMQRSSVVMIDDDEETAEDREEAEAARSGSAGSDDGLGGLDQTRIEPPVQPGPGRGGAAGSAGGPAGA